MQPLKTEIRKQVWKGLGSAQQKIAQEVPASGWVDYDYIELCCRCNRLQTGEVYIRKLLARLIERDVLRKGIASVEAVGGGTYNKAVYCRGDNWEAARRYYGWDVA